jgi:hypothetical protein
LHAHSYNSSRKNKFSQEKTNIKLKKYNKWVEYDIAIEIIGKMVAEQTQELYKLIALFDRMGFNIHDQVIIHDESYQYHIQRISELNAELKRLYSDENPAEILRKAYEVYAPYIKAQNSLHHELTTSY